MRDAARAFDRTTLYQMRLNTWHMEFSEHIFVNYYFQVFSELTSFASTFLIVWRKTRHVPSSQSSCKYSNFASELNSRTTTPSLQGEAPRQFLTSDCEVIVCDHPSLPVDISNRR